MKTEPKSFHFFLPNLFTALNMGCGFFAVVFAIKGQFYQACILVGVGAIFDLFDGKVARWTGTQSAFGEQFDSLSDLITFGIAPSLVFYMRFLENSGRRGVVVAFIYVLCAALRLARFNVNINKVPSEYFQGLPSPGSALAIISFILLSLEAKFVKIESVCLFYLVFYAGLMISTIPFFSLKNTSVVARNKMKILIALILLLTSILIYEEVMLFSLMSLYVLGSISYYFFNRKKFQAGIIAIDDED